ncbi:MAG: siroheme synthase CysG [Allorhizobium sp.]
MRVMQPLPNKSAEASARMEPLAVMPLFWSLTGRKVLIAGGSEAAAWKAELMAASGAQVHVYARAETLSPTMAAIIAAKTLAAGSITHCNRDWTEEGTFEGAALAIGDCDSEGSARAFYDAARTAGVPVNVIDQPAYCQFQFGSIVNRSPVVVAISTNGAAPILAQAIRRRIEALLPPALKRWAILAQSMRAKVNAALPAGQPRRHFWERFVDRAFSSADGPAADIEGHLLADAAMFATTQAKMCGIVTLVGAGPGDAEMLTLKAMRALQAADVILFDDLVSGEVLELARREAKRMLVGKRGGRESCRQEDINDMMVSLARAGKRVVRLKAGDPMIFGRAGEEIARLEQEGIPCEVIPGITSASAMAARLGISLTHRDHAQSVRFVTGHSRHGELPDGLDWQALSSPANTTIYYMSGRTAGRICAELLSAGMAGDTPTVIMAAVSRANEQRWAGMLSEMPLAMQEIGVGEPVLIGVGTVFAPLLFRQADLHRHPAHSTRRYLHQ